MEDFQEEVMALLLVMFLQSSNEGAIAIINGDQIVIDAQLQKIDLKN